ncbi:MAG: FTR1 family protein, partial [Candidatus Bipolaricaulia bacterium]
MVASFLITFREALEAALIIGIIAAYLAKINRGDLLRYLYLGAGGAVLGSGLLGWIFTAVSGGLSGGAEKIFEGLAALSAAAVLTYMIGWMGRNARRIKGELEQRVEVSVSRGQLFGIAALAFIAVFREGAETVLFLVTLALQDPVGTLIGLAVGLAAVILLALLGIQGIYRLNLRRFFQWTSILLLIFAAGLVAYGVHELNEAGIIPPLIEHLWDINPPQNPDGGYPLLHEKGAVGSILKSLLGYNGNPSLTEVLAYLAY